MLSVELGHLADILDAAKQSKNVSSLARQWSSRIHNAIWNTTVCGVFFDRKDSCTQESNEGLVRYRS